ncbi:hypothetical protein VH22019_00009 [Vibrio phage VH2_2019]|nr:hypothetical protein VH22019_00009 [Vibrio phage VH2_2019]
MAKAPKKAGTPTGSAAEKLLDGEGTANAKVGVKTTTKKAATTPKKAPTAAQQKKILAVAPLPTDAIGDTVVAIENLKASEAIPLVTEMMESNDFNEFKMGGVLSVIDANGYWRDQGYEKFGDFIEGHYGIKYRKAMYLIGIYNSLVESGVEWEQVSSLGWTKLKEICGFLTPDNVDKWVELASSMSTISLIAYIKTCDENGEPKEVSGGSDKNPAANPEVSHMTFKVHTEQREIIRDALDKAKDETGTEHDNVALEHMATQYLQGTLGKKGAKPAKQKTLAEQIADLHSKDADSAIETILNQVAALYPEYDITVAPAGEDEEVEEETEE